MVKGDQSFGERNNFVKKASAKKSAKKDSVVAKVQSLDELKQLSVQGDAQAQYTLGDRYYQGQDVEQDYKQAFAWMEKSAL